MEPGVHPRRHSGPRPVRHQPQKAKQSADSVGGPSRKIEVSHHVPFTTAPISHDFNAVILVLTPGAWTPPSPSSARTVSRSETRRCPVVPIVRHHINEPLVGVVVGGVVLILGADLLHPGELNITTARRCPRSIAPDRVPADRKGISGSSAARGRMWDQPAQAPPRVATRYDKLAVRYDATVLVAAINEWL